MQNTSTFLSIINTDEKKNEIELNIKKKKSFLYHNFYISFYTSTFLTDLTFLTVIQFRFERKVIKRGSHT
jgi:heme/copper-type cytochrome/quinol oxidase subunit 4